MKKPPCQAAPSSYKNEQFEDGVSPARNQFLSRVSTRASVALTGNHALLCARRHVYLSQERACPLCTIAETLGKTRTERRSSHEIV